ncbi:MHYT domain-containing protein [Frankia sp. CiP3]|uniref:MHYT domain-containing protein n=1 Tax=Frankia sp. CiP3 TaxID=2880971 RepID=UPI001EF6529F|nr:MHYT domain-containing protein [Frankia sp. CiP3]
MDLTTATRHAADYDLLFVGVSVALATVGSFAALVSALRIPLSGAATRLRWVLSAALSLGGGAIWAMHFMGMVAYHIDGMDITYDIGLTALSLVIAVAVSGIGLVVVGTNPRSVARLGAGGLIAGLGVAAMHYTGMAAMRTGGTVTYDTKLVAISVVIAVLAALAALWITFRVRSRSHVLVASLVMAAAVCGMHYTGMAATRVTGISGASEPSGGVDPITLSLVVCVLTFSILALVIFAALGGVSETDVFTRAAHAHDQTANLGGRPDMSGGKPGMAAGSGAFGPAAPAGRAAPVLTIAAQGADVFGQAGDPGRQGRRRGHATRR